MTDSQSAQQFVQMSDEEAMYQEEVQKLEKRGKRLRRAALCAGIFSVISIICTIYTTIAVRWTLIEWQQPEKTAYEISESMAMYKFGIIGDISVVISDTMVGVLLGLILIGAGVNPATSSILIAFKLIQQSINGANVLFSIAAGLLLDENLPIAEVVQKYFYSDNMPPIGTQIAYMFLMLNQYGHYFMQSKYSCASFLMEIHTFSIQTPTHSNYPYLSHFLLQSSVVSSLVSLDSPSSCGVSSLAGWDTS